MTLPDPPLLLVTDRRLADRPLTDIVAAAFEAGCRWVMVREKDLTTAALIPIVSDIVAAGRAYGATVVVNGDRTAAARAGAHGIHLPQEAAAAAIAAGRLDETGGMVGVSAHSPAEGQSAAGAGASYVSFSPVFASVSKPGYGPRSEDAGTTGLDGLAAVARAISCPVIALGGVTADNAAACLKAGAAGVAVLGSVMQADNPFAASAALVAAIRAQAK